MWKVRELFDRVVEPTDRVIGSCRGRSCLLHNIVHVTLSRLWLTQGTWHAFVRSRFQMAEQWNPSTAFVLRWTELLATSG